MLPITSNLILALETILFTFIYFRYNWFRYSRIRQLKVIVLYLLIFSITILTDRSSLLYIYINVYFQLDLTAVMSNFILLNSMRKYQNTTCFLYSIFPSLSIRSFLIILIYFVFHHTIESSTRYENILLQNSYYILLLSLKITVLEELKLIVILAYYSIQNNEKALRNTIVAIYIKGFNFNFHCANKKIHLIILFLYLRMMKILNNRLLYARIVYSKDMNLDYKANWLLK